MSKKGKKKVITDESSFALIVDNPQKTVKGCAKCMRKVLNIAWLGFDESVINNKRILFLLNSSDGSTAYDKKRDQRYSVIPLDSTDVEGTPYWITVSLIFASALTQYRLEEVKLFVFRGQMIDPEKEAFFRAEWCITTDNKRKDAQPHWHVYRIFQDKEFIKDDIIDFQPSSPEDEVRDFGEKVAPPALEANLLEKDAPFEKFHFAMASSWHLNDEHQIFFETEQSLFDWLSRCINYIRKQLNYISTKEGTV
ncbi:MAG TPA: hypothetical protein ENH01_02325 [Nitrospirae bacterium]|nr:hypothetical protein [Nitrospirota bacterium]